MQIPLIYILITAEALLIFLGISVTLAIILLRKPKITTEEQTIQQAEDELDAIDLDNSYIDFLEQAIVRNTSKTEQQQNIEKDIADSEDTIEDNDKKEDESPAPDETQSNLLQIRSQFLLMEKSAAEKSEHEIHFWESIYDGMKNLLEQFSTTEVASSEPATPDNPAAESKEKVFYIETQGKKIDGEVNKLKDIIFEQENALSSMKKAMKNAGDELPDESESLKVLNEQIQAIERQLNDSKMCMEVLEMENNRLQEEVDKMEARHDHLFKEDDSENTDENTPAIDLEQMKEVVEQQENKIKQLIETIESLEIDASQAEKLRETIKDFSRTSQEMMSCISILEEENDRLKSSTDDSAEPEDASTGDEDITTLKTKISELEEEIIKKDVTHAQLQDEFSSMETEYLAMYEAMHGDNS